jgi:hypothetical protein
MEAADTVLSSHIGEHIVVYYLDGEEGDEGVLEAATAVWIKLNRGETQGTVLIPRTAIKMIRLIAVDT